MNSKALRYRLFGTYLAIMAVLLGAFAGVTYWLFARSLYWDLDQQLTAMARIAALSLGKQKHPQIDLNDDIWDDLEIRGVTLEWFDANGKPLATQGRRRSSLPPQVSDSVQQIGQLRQLTIAVRSPDIQRAGQLQGYVRVSKSLRTVDELLEKWRWRLSLGLLTELGLCGLGGYWLTRQTVQPIEQSLMRVKWFTANASHELRSPLTVIKSNIGLILNHPERIHAADKKRIAAIAWAADQMTNLIEDLLFLARSDQTQQIPHSAKAPLDLEPTLKSLVESFEPQAQAKEILLTSDLTSGLYVLGDIAHINRLFSNLIGNAIQYTPKGGRIWVTARTQGTQIQVDVRDTGIGIATEDRDRIFDPFWQADEARSYHSSGYGLGLAIAKTITTQHSGKIYVNSELGQGTTFTVVLPLSFSVMS
ncbi:MULTISPECIES: sensor histidine kinase [Chroococcidiopsis]|uniref:histidine kinase n=1 Tax=Chroococcidiopsis thermalis (strain PCC 7203) TaxID=251229 RepID=K9U337_CHRTP|nr:MULTISPECIES: ATP-binding protein [Chroococcidiopsis]AFY88826.1 histidine kinase [Chroococcidiopsis thermalis PCC 7203]URD48145.1 HAMP domain-containing histidine kinase [Chroococcidiopsis sp. CCNUC1]